MNTTTRALVIEATFYAVGDIGELSGSATDLHRRLTPDPVPLEWPRNAISFGRHLVAAIDELRDLGIAVHRTNDVDGRVFRIAEIRERPKAKPAPTLTGPLVVVREDSADALHQLAKFVVARRRERGDLCPKCARFDVIPGPDGWCARCVSDRRVERNEAERRAKERKLRWWHSQDGGAQQRAARQAAEAAGGS